MEMIEEDYVSFETAKLLKEKGFDEITFTWYTGKGKFCVGKNNFDDYHMNHFSNMAVARDKNKCSAPTLQRAMKWLRKAYHLYIGANLIIDFSGRLYWDYNIDTVVNNDKVIYVSDDIFNTYEDAVEAAIRYSLENLI